MRDDRPPAAEYGGSGNGFADERPRRQKGRAGLKEVGRKFSARNISAHRFSGFPEPRSLSRYGKNDSYSETAYLASTAFCFAPPEGPLAPYSKAIPISKSTSGTRDATIRSFQLVTAGLYENATSFPGFDPANRSFRV